MSDLLPDAVQVIPPAGEQLVEAVPVLLGEGPVHGGGHHHALVGLVQLGADQLGLENCNERGSTLESSIYCDTLQPNFAFQRLIAALLIVRQRDNLLAVSQVQLLTFTNRKQSIFAQQIAIFHSKSIKGAIKFKKVVVDFAKVEEYFYVH